MRQKSLQRILAHWYIGLSVPRGEDRRCCSRRGYTGCNCIWSTLHRLKQFVSGCNCIWYTPQKALIVSGCTVSGYKKYPPCCNCIRLQCIRLQLYPVAIVSGCISRGFAVVSSLYPVSGCSCIWSTLYELYLNCISKSLNFSHCIRLQLYPVALYPVAVFDCIRLQLYLVKNCRLPNPDGRLWRKQHAQQNFIMLS